MAKESSFSLPRQQRMRRRSKRQLVLPPGAAYIVQSLAAERILHQMMADQIRQPWRPLESAALERLFHDFPQLCRTTYEFDFGKQGHSSCLVSYHPLHVILRFQSPWSLIQTMLQACPEALHVRDASGIAPIHIACKYHAPIQVLEGLSAWQTDIMGSPARESGWLPLHFGCATKTRQKTPNMMQSTQHTIGESSNTDDEMEPECRIRCLLQLYPAAATTSEAYNGCLPVHLALAAGHSLPVIQALFEHAESKSSQIVDRHGRTPLHYACRYGARLSVVKYFIEHLNASQSEILIETHTGYTALHLAAAFSTVAVLEYLLKTLECTFATSQTNHLSETLVHAPTGCSLLHLAIQKENDCEMIQYLAQRFPGCLTAKEYVRGHTPLHTAAAVAPRLVPVLVHYNRKCLLEPDGQGHLPLDVANRYQKKHGEAVVQWLSQETMRG